MATKRDIEAAMYAYRHESDDDLNDGIARRESALRDGFLTRREVRTFLAEIRARRAALYGRAADLTPDIRRCAVCERQFDAAIANGSRYCVSCDRVLGGSK